MDSLSPSAFLMDQHLLSQEAKEDAEMDAEIAMEMALERQRKLSTTSNNSSAGGMSFVGPCPHSPGQVAAITSLFSQLRILTRPETALEW